MNTTMNNSTTHTPDPIPTPQIDSFWADLETQPDNWTLRSIFADYCEDEYHATKDLVGDPDILIYSARHYQLALYLRWTIRERKRPYEDTGLEPEPLTSIWRWTVAEASFNLHDSAVYFIIGNNLSRGKVGGPYNKDRLYLTLKDAEEDMCEAYNIWLAREWELLQKMAEALAPQNTYEDTRDY